MASLCKILNPNLDYELPRAGHFLGLTPEGPKYALVRWACQRKKLNSSEVLQNFVFYPLRDRAILKEKHAKESPSLRQASNISGISK